MHTDEKRRMAEAVFEIVRRIPQGRATSYGAIARAVGYPGYSRLVGKIMAGSAGNDIPAHRVVNSQGILSGKEAFSNEGGMQALLEAEGVSVRNGRICHWKSIFWDPLEEIGFDSPE